MIRSSDAIFACDDVPATVQFYKDVLGFESGWLWGDPPTFGGVRLQHVQIMFCRQPDKIGKVEGLMHMFRVDEIHPLYEKHKAAGAPIIHDLENKPWGMSEYVVRDPNGYHLRFGGPELYERKGTAAESMPPHIRIERRTPALDEYMRVIESVGWLKDVAAMNDALERSVLFVLATDTRSGQVIGMTRVTGDRRAYFICDVAVMPDHQHQKIGSALMEHALAELRKTGPTGTFVGLFTGKPQFYERLGFQKDLGMHVAL